MTWIKRKCNSGYFIFCQQIILSTLRIRWIWWNFYLIESYSISTLPFWLITLRSIILVCSFWISSLRYPRQRVPSSPTTVLASTRNKLQVQFNHTHTLTHMGTVLSFVNFMTTTKNNRKCVSQAWLGTATHSTRSCRLPLSPREHRLLMSYFDCCCLFYVFSLAIFCCD